jgi:hypothetical protein
VQSPSSDTGAVFLDFSSSISWSSFFQHRDDLAADNYPFGVILHTQEMFPGTDTKTKGCWPMTGVLVNAREELWQP